MSNDQVMHQGGCHCGVVRFSIIGALDRVVACHCRDCLKCTGNSVAATAVFNDQITITGDTLSWYRSSAQAEQGFCSACGSSLFYRGMDSPTISITAGVMDNPGVLEFGGHIHLHDHPGHQPLEPAPADIHDAFISGGRGMKRDKA